MARRTWIVGAGLWASIVCVSLAQSKPPRPELTTIVTTTPVKAGETAKLTLKVRLPAEIHVQSDKPKDPFLIPTALTVTPPPGVTVGSIVYPKPIDFSQAGRSEPLAVFGGAFTITVDLSLSPEVGAGDLVVPAQFRYQPCDASVCYAPAKADVKWTLIISREGS